MKRTLIPTIGLALVLTLAQPARTASADEFFRVLVLTVPTTTLTAEQFLTGDKNGKPTVVAGELRLPGPGRSTEKLPAVILVPGLGGFDSATERWARELNSTGVATFILDSFAGRGLFSMNENGRLHPLAIMNDAYRALALLAEHPRIDPGRVAIMGFSYGTVAALYSSSERFRKMYGPSAAQFAAHIGLYSLCSTTYHEDAIVTGKSIRLFHGIVDEATSILQCRSYVERLKKAGADVTLTEFPDAHHGYDYVEFPNPIKLAEAPTSRNCWWEEAEGGQRINAKTGKPFDPKNPDSYSCMEKGWTLGYNAAAYEATLQTVKEFLKTTFNIKQKSPS
jgi:dienelactone hydrolase